MDAAVKQDRAGALASAGLLLVDVSPKLCVLHRFPRKDKRKRSHVSTIPEFPLPTVVTLQRCKRRMSPLLCGAEDQSTGKVTQQQPFDITIVFYTERDHTLSSQV